MSSHTAPPIALAADGESLPSSRWRVAWMSDASGLAIMTWASVSDFSCTSWIG